MITLVVFSKDRAMQLDSLLRSVKDHCTGIDRIVVLAKVSSNLHEEAYWKLCNESMAMDAFTELRIELTESCGALLSQELTKHPSDHLALAVDDMTFYAPSDFKTAVHELDAEGAFVWSWRLGFRKPGVEWDSETFWYCSALSSDRDYGYLWHSDGALYKTTDYTGMLNAFLLDWRTGSYTPNDLEAAVASRKAKWGARVGPHLGPLTPTCITWQLNRVQTSTARPPRRSPRRTLTRSLPPTSPANA